MKEIINTMIIMENINNGIQDHALINDHLTHIHSLDKSNINRSTLGAVCPLCKEIMTPVFRTNKSSQHFKHLSKSFHKIQAHTPESIMHANVKYHIANQLQQQRTYGERLHAARR